MKMACARCVEDLGLLNLLVRLLDSTQQCLSAAKGAFMPKYVPFSLPRSLYFHWIVQHVVEFCSSAPVIIPSDATDNYWKIMITIYWCCPHSMRSRVCVILFIDQQQQQWLAGCCWALCRQEILVDGCGRTAGAMLPVLALSSKCGQCHVGHRHGRLIADLLIKNVFIPYVVCCVHCWALQKWLNQLWRRLGGRL